MSLGLETMNRFTRKHEVVLETVFGQGPETRTLILLAGVLEPKS
jgi:hypothetical protein